MLQDDLTTTATEDSKTVTAAEVVTITAAAEVVTTAATGVPVNTGTLKCRSHHCHRDDVIFKAHGPLTGYCVRTDR